MEQDTTRVEASVGSLASIVASDGPLGFADVLGLGADVADSLADRHAGGEAHGAVHPRAIVRGSSGPWVLAAPGLAAGTKASVAPELAEGDAATPAGDVFALGATLVFALTGQEFVDGALGAAEPGDAAGAAAAATTAPAPTGPLSLPDVMALFLDTLRRTLATDPAMRGTAAQLAGTLRQLRNDAERAMAPVADDLDRRDPAGSAAGAAVMTAGTAAAASRAIASERDVTAPATAGAAVVGAGAAGAATAPGVIAVDGTTTTTETTKKSLKQRLPALVAVAAVIAAVVLGGLLLRKDNKPVADVAAVGPTTTTTVAPTTSLVPQTVIVVVTEPPTSSTSTTATTVKPTSTTAPPPPVTPPPTAPPPVTVPPPPAGTVGMTVDMSQMISCTTCPAPVRSQPSKFAQILFSAPDKTVLWAQYCVTGDTTTVDGRSDSRWVYVVGPLSPGFVSVLFLGGAVPAELGACQAATTTTAPTTTAKP